MKILKNITAHFLESEDGAVTVDWVVLTTALVGLAVMAVVSGGVEDLSSDVDTQLVDQEIQTSFEAATASLYDGDWLAPGTIDRDSARVAQLSDASITGILSGYAEFSNPDNVNTGTHNESRYHDQYWMAHNQAIERGLEIPENINV